MGIIRKYCNSTFELSILGSIVLRAKSHSIFEPACWLWASLLISLVLCLWIYKTRYLNGNSQSIFQNICFIATLAVLRIKRKTLCMPSKFSLTRYPPSKYFGLNTGSLSKPRRLLKFTASSRNHSATAVYEYDDSFSPSFCVY